MAKFLALICCFVLAIQPSYEMDCPSDLESMGTFFSVENVGCYFVGSEVPEMSFYDALAYCNKNGGILAEPTNSLEQEALANLAGDSWWIGATDVRSEGQFEWKSGAPWTFTNWNSGEPNHGGYGEDCVVMTSEYGSPWRWNNVNCNSLVKPICQYSGKLF